MGAGRVAVRALAEMARHDRGGLVLVVVFAVDFAALLTTLWAGVTPVWSLDALAGCLVGYHMRRTRAELREVDATVTALQGKYDKEQAERRRGRTVTGTRLAGGEDG